MFKYVAWSMVGVAIFSLAFWCGIGYIAIHFISKFW